MQELKQTIEQSKSLLWGVSVALSWMWGIGLFFSVQMAIQFGVWGLVSFALINALGLFLFGYYTHKMAARFTSPKMFEAHFFEKANGLRGAIFLYQILAILITLFALLRYIFLPAGFSLPLICVIILGVTLFFGEEFSIEKIKYLHSYWMLGILLAMFTLVLYVLPNPFAQPLDEYLQSSVKHISNVLLMEGHSSAISTYFFFFMVPIAIGFFLGPWLDLQQWQRAVQINKEGLSIVGSYACGAIIFFTLLVFHGLLALTIFNAAGGAPILTGPAIDGQFHAKDVMMQYFTIEGNQNMVFSGFYIGFVCLCALATFDSGYLALRWFFEDAVGRSKNMMLAIVPKKLITSPLIYFIGICAVALVCAYMRLELEYIMSFYASFLVGYIVILYRRTMFDAVKMDVPQMKLFSVSLFSIALFSLGWFNELASLMAIASMIPFFYGIYITPSIKGKRAATAGVASESETSTDVSRRTEDAEGEVATTDQAPAPAKDPARQVREITSADGTPAGGVVPVGSTETLSTYFEDKWFVHQFTATYSDTNSVGNVYFGMYAFWVGKTRELFFNHVMPDFDLKTTDYYILTREFNHKFVREAREFETIKVKIRVSGTNRKFCNLEHKIYNGDNELLGKGSQALLFVSSEDYGLLDIPQETYTAFLPYLYLY